MHLIVGLGNPGAEYKNTRHNAGFLVVERFIATRGMGRTRRRYHGRWCEGVWQNHWLALLQPLTFMNRSGLAVAEAALRKQIPSEKIVIVHDDLDFPFGVVRAKKGGGLGGHKGLESVARSLGTTGFSRVRVGVGRPEDPNEDPRDWVLASFHKSEAEINAVLDTACDCAWVIVEEGIEAAMSRFNRRRPESSDANGQV